MPNRPTPLALAALLLFPALAAAQDNTTDTRAIQSTLTSLSPEAQANLQRLSALSLVPLGTIRLHTGSLVHGEAPALSDASWSALTLPTPEASPAVADDLWLRTTITVPATALPGSTLVLDPPSWDLMTVFVDGNRIAYGDRLEPLTLAANVHPGQVFHLALHIARTPEPKHLDAIEVHIQAPEGQSDPYQVRAELLSAAIRARAAQQQQALTQVSQIAAAIHTAPGQLESSLAQAETKLRPVVAAMPPISFHETGNSHIDAAWLWPWTETVDAVHRTFGTAAQLLAEYPTDTFTQSAAQYNVWMAEKYPDLNQRMADYIKQGRWEVVGGMWVEPDLNMPDGESLVRQLLIGKRTYKQLYGVDVRIGWNPDSFGYNWQLPQIYKKSGVDYFVTQKMSWNDTNKLPLKLFWWQSPDGSKVLTYFPDGYGNTDFSPIRLTQNWETAQKLAPGLPETFDLYGIGDHGGGATRELLDEGARWSEPARVAPPLHFGIAQPYFSSVEGKIASQSPVWDYKTVATGNTQLAAPAAGQISIPTWNDELYLEFHRGVFTTQAEHKNHMRESEEQLLNAEKWSALATLDGLAYPGERLNEGWKKVLFNQFHDLAAGSGIGIIYKDADRDYEEVRLWSDEASHNALHTLGEQVDTRKAFSDGSVAVMVTNPLSWTRSGLVTAKVQLPAPSDNVSVVGPDGHAVPSHAVAAGAPGAWRVEMEAMDVPSLGYKVYRVVPGQKPFASDLRASGTTIENANLRVTVDPHTGCITSFYNKRDNFETLASGSCGNELIAFVDKPKQYDAWNIDADFKDHFTKLDMVDSVKLVENSPFRAAVRITRHWQSSNFVQEISLAPGAEMATVTNDFDWHETHVLLKAAFDLAAGAPFATYEIPYGSIQRPTTRNNSWEQARFEVPAMRWADEGDGTHGFSLVNENKYGYDAVGNTLRLTLLRSPTSPDPDADRGPHHFSYYLYPHAGTWQQAMTVRHGYESNYKLEATALTPHEGPMGMTSSYIGTTAPNIVITAVKKAEDSNALLVRFYEWAGKDGSVALTVPPNAQSARLVDLQEHPVANAGVLNTAAGANGSSTVSGIPVHPYEIVTVEVTYSVPPQQAELR